MEVTELFVALESNQPQIFEDCKKKFHELFNSSGDTWLVSGLFDYAMQTGSLRTVEILVGIREPHDIYLFNKFCESLRNNNKINSLTLLGHIVRRQPTWLYKIAKHSLFRDLLRLLKTETELIPLMSALLVINILLPMVAGLMDTYLQEIFQVFSHLAVWDTTNPTKLPEPHLLHLQMALYALFLRLYGMYPCSFINYLKQEYSHPHKSAIYNHTIKPMLDNVKLHPSLVMPYKEPETTPARWRKLEPHDVIVECAKYAIGGEIERPRDDGGSRISLDFSQTLEHKYAGRSGSGLTEKDPWSPTSFCGMSTPPESAPTSIPHTPIAQTHIVSTSFPQQEGTSPPEAAVEATPETTPIKDIRSVVRAPPSNSNVPRALNTITSSPSHSQPSSPMKKELSPFRFPSNSETSAFHQPHDLRRDSLLSQKMQRIVSDRNQLSGDGVESKMKPRGLLQPTSPLRVINSASDRFGNESPGDFAADQEDKEVEIMMTTDNNSSNNTTRLCDSAVQDITSTDHEELEECHLEACTAGKGLCMPNSNSMRDFARQVKSRLRFYSQCHPDASCPGLSTGSSPSEGYCIPVNTKVRRTNSCPEMKKTSSSLERHPVEKVEEEPSPLNGHAAEFAEVSSEDRKTACAGTQTDNPLPYEHLFLAVFPTVDQNHHINNQQYVDDGSTGHETGHSSPLTLKRFSPNEVDLFMNTNTSIVCDMKKNKLNVDFELRCCKEQLSLMILQLHFEKHRREMHAERNRRLLGKCRKVRSQEELTSALKDQLSLLQNDNEALHSNLHKRMDEAKAYAQQLQETVTYYQNQNTQLQAEFLKEKALRESTEELLRREKDKTVAVVKELNETKATLFNTTTELQHVANVAGEGKDLRETVASLQRELVVGGEMQERYRQRVNSLMRHLSQSSEVSLLQESFTQQISALNQALEAQTASLEAAKTRVGELDSLLGKKDATIAESKRLLQEAKDEYHEQLEAVESKYKSLRAINSRLECEMMELRHQLTSCSVQPPPTMPPALPPATSSGAFHNLQAGADIPDTSPPHSPGDQNG
ncbi:hamartin [Macrosteles quadrilineatus]|uniref:hamartin n=1 Tax=Macrosteles quadrilineatus TaxID=74068 RepID=UPI0023E1F511|nr:hamartin [Macrosteles quadrilineatus]